MAKADPIAPINGKRLILILGVGALLFTIVMGFGTYLMAQVMNKVLQKHPAHGGIRSRIDHT